MRSFFPFFVLWITDMNLMGQPGMEAHHTFKKKGQSIIKQREKILVYIASAYKKFLLFIFLE